ncbi:SDR family NAD(P)-dependent oxidoreductase, partial [Amycolatopsis minnesotensis]|uniref:type I polyketide synthase n=1 Tax=Amycolatopsis minnesotensis TaxID=337894 RepID=UPI003CD0B441
MGVRVSEEKLVAALRRSVKEAEALRERNRKLSDGLHEPVAIVGMACRFPGGVGNPDDLWRLLDSGGDAITGLPGDRGWQSVSADWKGGFLRDATLFDATVFGISPNEALLMDPQQRQLLELSWEVLERAGFDPRSMRGSRTGVFVGAGYQGYAHDTAAIPEGAIGHRLTGNSGSVLSGRIAYTYGFEGPAITVDTACSSSLVALHWAVQALRSGECSLAMAGGVTVMASPEIFVEFDRQGALASDGRCRSFAEAADGTSWSEGAGLVLVERLSDAVANGHEILAVVRGSAVNSDGASNGMTAPSGPAQQRVIRDALASARLSVEQVDVVEAHGTGTVLGDPIEAQALLATYGQGRVEPLWLGSVKSNLGHTQAAAGVAGVIKMVLAMRHGVLPETLHVDEPTGHVEWSAGAVELLTEARPWSEVGRPRRAGVSSFGISGTNAHVILEQAPVSESGAESGVESEGGDVAVSGGVVPWVLSAASGSGLSAVAARLESWVREHPGVPVTVVGRSLATTRAVLEHRAVVLGADRAELLAGLGRLAGGGGSGGGVVRGVAGEVGRGVVMVFPGQGSQWAGMAVGLLESSAVFAEAMGECARVLSGWVSWSLLEALSDPAGLARVDVVQPVLWAVMVSLARLWRSYGVEPAAVVGHSQGEIAAACVAGVLSLEEGARIVALRSQALAVLAGHGGMTAIAAPAETVRQWCGRWKGRVSIAAINSPASTIVSGDPDALTELARFCTEQDVRARRVEVDYASHSPHVDPLHHQLHTDLAGITGHTATVPFYSTVTATALEGTRLDTGYWFQNLRQPVRFADTITTLADHGYRTYLEISPHPILTTPITDTLTDHNTTATVLPSLHRDHPDHTHLHTTLAHLHTHTTPINWQHHYPPGPTTPLPTYPFQHQRYWLESTGSVRKGHDRSGQRYETRWQALPRPASAALDGTWLVLVPAEGVDDDAVRFVITELTRHGASVEPVTANREELARRSDVAGIVSLQAFDERTGTNTTLPQGFADTLTTIRAWAESGCAARLWCLTRRAVSTSPGDELASRAQAMVWGLGRVAAVEHPARWGGLIDLPERLGEQVGDELIGALAGAGEEDQVALRTDGSLAPRLVRAEEAPGDWRPQGTVLITGGTGAVASRIARCLAASGARDLLLADPLGADTPEAGELVAAMAELGATTTIAACDVTDRQALAELIGSAPELSAVVHTTSVAEDAPIASLGLDGCERAMAAKIEVAAWLDELTRDRQLDAFVVFSSTAGLLGGAGYPCYAASNAFVEALAVQRRAAGLPALAVAWGPWGDGPADAELARRGLGKVPTANAFAALVAALGQSASTAVIAEVDWARFAPVLTAARPCPLLRELPEARDLRPRTGDLVRGSAELRADLADLTEAERERYLLELVRSRAAAVLGHASSEDIPPARSFADLGFDSLTVVRMRDELAAATGLKFPSTLLFDYPAANSLARHLRDELTGGAAVPTVARGTRRAEKPIAIVGMSCRLPGGVKSPEELWDLVASGRDAISGFPEDRGWDGEGLYHPDPEHQGTSCTREGGFLHDLGGFDAEFFGISPREALATDPQQRILLELGWEALERAGIVPESLRGSDTGVFIGTSGQDYVRLLIAEPEQFEGRAGVGNIASVLSGRLAYTFGFEGPAVTVDTACSSSLVALHWAIQALRDGECSLAMVGGAAVMATPGAFVEFSRQGALSADGRCRAFGAGANGTGWGEGVGVLLVERLSDAVANGHEVLAVVRGSAVNSDGASNGLTAPSGPSQQRVIRQALASAGLTTSDVDVVEAHGTGTVLGDPIEAQALLATYGQGRVEPLWLGSVK